LVEGEDRDHTLPFEPVIVIYHQCGQSSRKTVDYTSFAVDSGRAKLEEPILQISHQCDMSVDDISKGHYRQFLIKVPFYYYNVGRVGLRDFNVGKLGLQLIYPGESINKLEDL
uniref:ZP domain-containing protein n=1 Tax=Anisakis simplex TaxID=6269 RepID=A0A0M3KC43_ANISI